MLLPIGDDRYAGGPLDVLLILHDVTRGTYHAAFFEEAPMPGPIEPVAATPRVRLRSNMHHTVGADTLEGAQVHLDDLARQIALPRGNVYRDDALAWNGDLGITLLASNWTTTADGAFGPAALGIAA